MNRKTKVISLSTIFLLFASSNALAQTRPAVHWTTFNKQASQCAFHLFALNALRSEGLNQVFEDTGTIILASGKVNASTAQMSLGYLVQIMRGRQTSETCSRWWRILSASASRAGQVRRCKYCSEDWKSWFKLRGWCLSTLETCSLTSKD